MKKLITAVVAAMAFATSMAFATTTTVATNYLPWVTVNISGTIAYQASMTTNGATSKGTLKTTSFSSKSLIALLNASTNAQAAILEQTGTNQIPAGSYFAFDTEDEYLYVTNKNGFAFNLDGHGDYGYLDFGYYYEPYYSGALIGSYSLNTNTWAGNEQDKTAVYFYFDDGNGNEIESYYGNGTMNWNYEAANETTNSADSVQKASLTINFKPAGYYAYVNNNQGITQNVNISGSGSALIWTLGGSFIWWW